MTNRLLALALGTLLLTGCSAQSSAPADTTADETMLKDITQTWVKAYSAGDADTIAALYADDAVLMPPHAPVARGRAAIREFIAKDSAGAKAAGEKIMTSAETVGVNGDWGWNSGSFTAVDGSGKAVDSGSFLSVSHKINGKWLYVRDMYNSDQPLPPSPPPAK